MMTFILHDVFVNASYVKIMVFMIVLSKIVNIIIQ
jgi:hypothetical protein